jgi:hypothetical protein
MANSEDLRSRVETMLKEHVGVDELVTDAEGDYPVRSGSAKYYVRLNDDDPASVTVYAHVLVGVTASPKLYETLNAVNGFIRFGRMFHQGDAVLASVELLAGTLDPEELATACRSIADLADHYDDLFQREFGGRREFEDDKSQPENAAPAK